MYGKLINTTDDQCQISNLGIDCVLSENEQESQSGEHYY